MLETTPNDFAAWRMQLVALAAQDAGTDGAHDGAHLDRVWRNAQALLAHHPEADRLVVLAASYLHDLVNLPKERPGAQPGVAPFGRTGARVARAAGLPARKTRRGRACHRGAQLFGGDSRHHDRGKDRAGRRPSRRPGPGGTGAHVLHRRAHGKRAGASDRSAGRRIARSTTPPTRSTTSSSSSTSCPDMMQTEAGARLGRKRLELLTTFRGAVRGRVERASSGVGQRACMSVAAHR